MSKINKITITDKVTITIGCMTILITLFDNEIKQFLFSVKWEYYTFIIGCLFILYAVISIVIRNIFNREVRNLLKDKDLEYKKIFDEFKKKKEEEQNLVSFFIKTTRINKALLQNLFVKYLNNDADKISEFLYNMYDTDKITIKDWKEFGISEEVITKMMINYHNFEIDNLSQKG